MNTQFDKPTLTDRVVFGCSYLFAACMLGMYKASNAIKQLFNLDK
jgi:hypothetical protein